MGPACQDLLGNCHKTIASLEPAPVVSLSCRQWLNAKDANHQTSRQLDTGLSPAHQPSPSSLLLDAWATRQRHPTAASLSLDPLLATSAPLFSSIQSSRDARPKSFPRFAERGGRRRLREAKAKPQTPMAAPAPRDVAVLLLLLFPVLAPVASAVPFIVLHGWGFSCLASILIHFLLGPFLIRVWLLGTRAGIGDECGNDGLASFTEMLGEWSGSKGYCM
jgi:hypothetical protein